jgi:hypothetical protein
MTAYFRRTLQQHILDKTYADLLRWSYAPQAYDVGSILVHSRATGVFGVTSQPGMCVHTRRDVLCMMMPCDTNIH